VGLAEEWHSTGPFLRLSHGVVGGDLDTLSVNGTLVGLVTTPVVKVIHSEQDSACVSTFPILRPMKNVRELLVLLGLGRAVHENCASFLGLALLVLWLGDVAILHVAHGNEPPGDSLQAGIFVIDLLCLSLVLVAEQSLLRNESPPALVCGYLPVH
jgi:hypothetical protein